MLIYVFQKRKTYIYTPVPIWLKVEFRRRFLVALRLSTLASTAALDLQLALRMNWLRDAGRQAAATSAMKRRRSIAQAASESLLHAHTWTTHREGAVPDVVEAMLTDAASPLPKAPNGPLDEQYQRLRRACKRLHTDAGILDGRVVETSFQQFWPSHKAEILAGVVVDTDWQVGVFADWIQSLISSLQAEPDHDEPPTGPFQVGMAPPPPDVTPKTISFLDLAMPKHVQDDLTAIDEYILQASAVSLGPRMTFDAAMALCTPWCEKAASRPCQSQHALLNRIYDIAKASDAHTEDATVKAALSTACVIKMMERPGASAGIGKHVSAARQTAQKNLVEYRRQQSMHDLWADASKNHRPPAVRKRLEQEVEADRYACFLYDRDVAEFQNHSADLASDTDDGAAVFAQVFLNMCAAQLYTNLGVQLHNLCANLRKTVAVCKRHRCDQELKERKRNITVHSNPNTVAMSWSAARDRIFLLSENGVVQWPNNARQLEAAAELFRILPVWTITCIRAELDTVAAATFKDVSKQLCEMLPVISVEERYEGGGRPPSGFLIDIASAQGGLYFWSLLGVSASSEDEGLDQLKLQADGEVDSLLDMDAGNGSDGSADPSVQDETQDRTGAGRPRLEDSSKYGELFVDWVRSFVHSKGQMRLSDQHRVCDTCEVFGAPLRLIAEKATEMGWPVSRTGIYNLFKAPRDNSTSSRCRGVVDARPTSVEPKEKAFHVRGRFSTVKVKYAEDFIDIVASLGICKVRRYHGDGMASTPMWIPARKGGKVGFTLARRNQEGKKMASIAVADHDFPLGPRMLLNLSGWMQCDSFEGKDMLVPSQMYAFVRPSRYVAKSAGTNLHDLMEAISADDESFDTLLLISDNAADYSQDVPVIQHIYGRIWRQQMLAKLMHGCHSPGSSARNVPVERAWTQPRSGLLGQELGRSVANTREDLFATFADSADDPVEAQENAFRAVTEKAMDTFVSIVKKCNTGGKPWAVKSIEPQETKEERAAALPLIPDYEKIVQYYAAGPRQRKSEAFADIAAEAKDHGDHLAKGPSFLEYTLCIDPDRCAACKSVLSKRQASNPSWHPKSLLAPLAFNNYVLPWPVKKIAAEVVEAMPKEAFDKECTEAARRTQLQCLMTKAVSVEDFIEAQRLKLELSKLEDEKAPAAAAASSKEALVTETKAVELIAMPTSSAKMHERPEYMSLREVMQQGRFQDSVEVPISSVGKRLESLLQCKVCQTYWAKTQTELDRHTSHNHGKLPAPPAIAAVPVDVSGFQEYSLHGAAAIQAAGKTKRKREEEEKPDAELAHVEPADEADMEVVFGGEPEEDSAPIPPAIRKPAEQCTPDEIKAMRPMANERRGVGLWVDRLNCYRFTAKYPQSKRWDIVNPEVIEALPAHLKEEVKSFPFGKHGNDAKQEEALEKALLWLWEKHNFFFPDDVRPDWTIPLST